MHPPLDLVIDEGRVIVSPVLDEGVKPAIASELSLNLTMGLDTSLMSSDTVQPHGVSSPVKWVSSKTVFRSRGQDRGQDRQQFVPRSSPRELILFFLFCLKQVFLCSPD